MSHMVESYCELLRRGPVSSLAGLWAYESQGESISDSKAEGLVKYYGAGSEAFAFWEAHGSIDDDHAAWTLEALVSLDPDVAEAQVAAQLIGNAWWDFLDEREFAKSS